MLDPWNHRMILTVLSAVLTIASMAFEVQSTTSLWIKGREFTVPRLLGDV